MFQSLILPFILQSTIDQWVHNQQILIGRFSQSVTVVLRFPSTLLGTVEAVDLGHVLLRGYIDVVAEVRSRSRAVQSRRPDFLTMLDRPGMTGAVFLPTRTLVLDNAMCFSMQMILGLVETGQPRNKS